MVYNGQSGQGFKDIFRNVGRVLKPALKPALKQAKEIGDRGRSWFSWRFNQRSCFR